MAQPTLASRILAQLANYPRLQPSAVLADASGEGLGGGIGDQGTSFGPFQLHQGGAYPQFAPQAEQAAQQWAWSPAGIRYALGGLNRVAAGQTGSQAITNMVTNFERPNAKYLQGEISGDISRFNSGQFGGQGLLTNSGVTPPNNGGTPYKATGAPLSGLPGSVGGKGQTLQTLPQNVSGAGRVAQNVAPGPTQAQLFQTRFTQARTSVANELLSAAQQLTNGGTPNLANLFAAAKNFQQVRLSAPKAAPLGAKTPLARSAAMKA